MSRRLVLCITNHHLLAYHWEANLFGDPVVFAQEETGRVRFREYLEQAGEPDAVLILIDITEEELKLERVPRLNPLSRSRMLQNRANRLLRHTAFRHALALGRAPGEEGQESALFAGLTAPEDGLLPWLAILEERRLPVAGIWSIPLLTPRLFRSQVDPSHRDQLLVSVNSGGLRQTYLRDGQILISRLSRIPAVEIEDLPPFLHGEVARMQGYLVSQRLYAWNTELQVYILCYPALHALMSRGPHEIGSARLHALDVTRLARELGLKNTLTTGKMDRLYAQGVIRWRIPNHYARDDDRMVYRILRLREGVRWAAMALFGVSLVAGAVLFLQGRALRDQQPALSREAEEVQRLVGRSTRNRSSQEGRAIIATVRLAGWVEARIADPRAMYAILGEVLARHEALLLDTLEWSAEEARPAGGKQAGGGSAGEKPMQRVRLTGRVQPFTTAREAMDTVERFVRELRARREVVEVQPARLPMQAGADAVIRSGEAVTAEQQARFELSILLHPPVGAS
ncbi:MAG: hypothetical protein HQL96_16520 [Magnetococcales bacterium]|nr:hypothetical protein [Magnetococcales bacterium]